MKHRIFLAIDLPHAVQVEVRQLQQLMDRIHVPVSWESVEKLHLTLNFVGTIPAEDVTVLRQRIAPVIKSYPPFFLTPYFLETLYNRHEPSLIYLAPKGDLDSLKNLQKDLKAVLNDLKMPQANRFLPHITIGRFKKADPVSIKKFIGQIDAYPFTPLSEFTVDHVAIYESLLSRQGSTYQIIDRIKM